MQNCGIIWCVAGFKRLPLGHQLVEVSFGLGTAWFTCGHCLQEINWALFFVLQVGVFFVLQLIIKRQVWLLSRLIAGSWYIYFHQMGKDSNNGQPTKKVTCKLHNISKCFSFELVSIVILIWQRRSLCDMAASEPTINVKIIIYENKCFFKKM